MDGKRSFTGWELEGQIRRVLADAPPGTPYCVLCLAEALEITSVQQYVTIPKRCAASARISQARTRRFKASAPRIPGTAGRAHSG